MAFVLLLVTFRSIVIPIKAIVLNLLSVSAALGIVTYVFQDGHFEDFLNFQSTGAITAWFPIMLFVILFGLSMDYHVFILSRIKEAVDRGESTDEAVSHGIKSTAGVVTAAAMVMVGVFSIFATLSFIDMKQFGVGPGGGGPDRRHPGPRRAAPGVDEAARRLELVPAPAARLAPEGRGASPSRSPHGPRTRSEALLPRHAPAHPRRARVRSPRWHGSRATVRERGRRLG